MASGQATAEFALVVPLLMLMMLAVVDFGRVVAMHAAIVTSSREAARYGSAIGTDTTFPGAERYRNCAGIKNAASAVTSGLVTLSSVSVTWDGGPTSTATKHDCTSANTNPDTTTIASFDRVVVEVQASISLISPVALLVPTYTATSVDRRTIAK